MTQPVLPEVRQCQDSTSHLFGATAVKGSGITANMWGVMDPEQGGHWSTDEDVATWAVIVQPGTSVAAAEEAPAEEAAPEEPVPPKKVAAK